MRLVSWCVAHILHNSARHGTAPCYWPSSIEGSHYCSVGSTFYLPFPFKLLVIWDY